MKPDEVLEVSLKLPFAPGASDELNDRAKDGNKQSTAGWVQGTGGALLGKQRPGLGGLGTLLPRPRFTSPAAPLLAPQNPPFSESQPGSTATDGGHFMLRCGNLLMSAEVQQLLSALRWLSARRHCVCSPHLPVHEGLKPGLWLLHLLAEATMYADVCPDHGNQPVHTVLHVGISSQ